MKNINLPSFSREQKKFIQKYENTPIAVIYYDTTTIQGNGRICKKISLFYSKLFDKFFKWLKNDFENYTQNDYLSDTNPRKKYRYIPFELKYQMTSNIKEPYYLEVSINITLLKKKSKISEKNIKHVWNLKNGNLHIQRKKD